MEDEKKIIEDVKKIVLKEIDELVASAKDTIDQDSAYACSDILASESIEEMIELLRDFRNNLPVRSLPERMRLKLKEVI